METSVQAMETELRTGFAERRFEVVYRPIWDLGEQREVGVEARPGWHHPSRGLRPAREFFPLLESSGRLAEFGRWVLDQACERLSAWRAEGRDVLLSVDVSGRQLGHEPLVEEIRAALDGSGLDPAALIVEVPEAALANDPRTTTHRLGALKDLGLLVAVDAFGTGYTRLAHFRRFPIDCLKVDRDLVDALRRSPGSESLMQALVRLGQDLGLRVLAEDGEPQLTSTLVAGA
jgi:EAL domain-containing protein (putative c-di-GMP-specific phosphodiesterase class I)